MTHEEIKALLAREESETLERKQSLDKDGIRKTIIAFANDLYGRGGGKLILGQAPDKTLIGLREHDDEVQQVITSIARNTCSPAIPVSVQIAEEQGKRIAIVEVRRSQARPHFTGKAWVRMGSTTRQATDAEIMLLRAVEENRKIAILKRWLDDGKTSLIFWQLPAAGQDFTHSPRVENVQLLEVEEDWIVLSFASGAKRAFPFAEFTLRYDPQQGSPQIRYHGGRGG